MLLRLGNISRKLRRVRKDYAENLYYCLGSNIAVDPNIVLKNLRQRI